MVVPSPGKITRSGWVIAMPNGLPSSAGLSVGTSAGSFGDHLLRRLVLAKAEEARVAQHVVAGELGERDLSDQLRRDPFDAARGDARHLGGRGLAHQRLELRHQHVARVRIEAGADAAGIPQFAALVDAHRKAAQVAPRLVALDEAQDHELLAPRAFGLEPVFRARAAIGGVGALRDDALVAAAAQRFEKLFAARGDVLGIVDRRHGVGEQGGEPVLALDIGEGCQVLTVLREQVEGEIL